MSDTESFSEYVKTCFIKPYHSFDIIEGILDHFELDVEDDDDYVENDNDLHFNDERESGKDPTILDTKEMVPLAASRWDKVNDDRFSDKESSTNNQNRNTSPPQKKPAEAEYLCKQDMKIQINSSNPLLANSRGKYIGRNLSSKFFDQVHVVSSSSLSSLNRKQLKGKKMDTLLETADVRTNKPSHSSESQKVSPTIPVSSFSIPTSTKTEQSEISGVAQLQSNRVTKTLRFGAAALAARAGLAIRKKAKKM